MLNAFRRIAVARGTSNKDSTGLCRSCRRPRCPGILVGLGRDTTTAVLGECVVDEEVDDLEDGQHAGTEQQTDEAAHLACRQQT